jgi:hypothetical protein
VEDHGVGRVAKSIVPCTIILKRVRKNLERKIIMVVVVWKKKGLCKKSIVKEGTVLIVGEDGENLFLLHASYSL